MLPVLQPKTLKDKHYWLPDIGEQVAVLLDGQAEDGVVLGAIFSDADAPPVTDPDKHHVKYQDGAEFEYDRKSSTLTIQGGILHIIIEVGTDVSIKAGTKVTIDVPETEITGNVLVKGMLAYQGGMAGSGGDGGVAARINGNINVNGNVNAIGDVKAGTVSLQGHQHPGDSGGTTGAPIP